MLYEVKHDLIVGLLQRETLDWIYEMALQHLRICQAIQRRTIMKALMSICTARFKS